MDLLRPFESEEMEMSPANEAVGNVRNNGPETLNSEDLISRRVYFFGAANQPGGMFRCSVSGFSMGPSGCFLANCTAASNP